MFILIVNEDPLGRALAAALVERGHEVAYLDADEEYCQMVATELGCLVIRGETTNIRALQEAGIERADVLVALLEKDSKNIIVGLFGRQFGVPTIMACMRQKHYQEAYTLAGIEQIFSAFDILFNRMLQAIEEPELRQIMALGDGTSQIAAIDIPPESTWVGRPLQAVWDHASFPNMLILGLLKKRQQHFHHAAERPTIEAFDELIALGSHQDIHQLVQLLEKN
ncbi:MAG: TrkA family potassium uptake protein [Ardenticatenaceae bacterium]|nr:TrkA family potassium uptake protein [Ardenticatenaceae bacterium]